MNHFALERPPDVEDWLDLRSPYYNASVAGALFGVHPWETLGDVVTQKLTGKRTPENAAMRRGIAMEPYIRDIARDHWSKDWLVPAYLYGYGPLLYTSDGLTPEEDDPLLEVKSTSDWLGAEPPKSWWWQVQAGCGCAQRKRGVIAYLDSRLEVGYYEVEFDPKSFKMLVSRAADVMAAIDLGEVPGGVDLSARNVSELYVTDDGEAVTLPDSAHLLEVLLAYQEAGRQETAAAEQKSLARDQLVRWLGPHSIGMAEGLDLYSFKQPRASRGVNTKRLLEEHPELVEAYTEDIPNARRIHLKHRNIIEASKKVWPEAEREEPL